MVRGGLLGGHRRGAIIPGTRDLYVSLNNQRSHALVVLNFEAFAARGR